MILGIHNGSALNEKCINYCVENKIPHIVLDCYAPDILNVVKENNITHLFWHFHHILHADILMARNVLFALEKMGVKVYPNFNTCWYFDDKISEKYILEAINAPIVTSWPFYTKETAMTFLKTVAKYPLVAKLRRGAGSYNVILLKNKSQAARYVRRMFSTGISPAPKFYADVKTKFIVARRNGTIVERLKKIPRFFRVMTSAKKSFPKELGYVYFQEFISGASCDYRIVVVGDKAWGSLRKVRKNDFRASGAGQSYENPNLIPTKLVDIAFHLTDKLNAQSMSYDFVLDTSGNPHIVEISYCFGFDGGDGSFYWDRKLNVHFETFTLEELLLKELLTR